MKNKIYKITCTVNNMFYIGRTSQPLTKRLEQHMARLKAGKHNKKFQNCYSKYGPESFTIELVQDLNNTDKLQAQTLEEQLIRLYWGNKKLLNCSKAGEGGHTTAGYDEDETLEYRAKLSAAHRGKILSEAHRAKLSVSKTGEKNPQFGLTGAKSPTFGLKRSKETKARLSAAKAGKKNPALGRLGEENPHAKLTWDQVNQIREDYKAGTVSYNTLALRYSMTRSAIAHLVQGRTWPDPNYTYTPKR